MTPSPQTPAFSLRNAFVLVVLIALGVLALVFGGPSQHGQGNAAGSTYTTTCTVVVSDPTPTATLTNNGPIYAGTGKNSDGVAGALTWGSTNAASCTGTGFTAGGPSGTAPTGVLAGSQSYSVNCNGAVANTTVTVITPTATITANPTRVKDAASHSTITWTTSLCTDVTVSGTNGFSSTQPQGTAVDTGAIGTHGATFTVTCDGGSASANVIVNVAAQFEEF